MIWSYQWSRSFWWSWSELGNDLDHSNDLDLWSDLFWEELCKRSRSFSNWIRSSLVTLCLFFSNSEKCNVHTMSLLGFRALPYYKEGRIFKRLRVFVHPWNWKFKWPVTEGGGGLIVSRYSVRERKCCLVGKFWP